MAITKGQLRSVWAVSIAMAAAFLVLVRAVSDVTAYADTGDYIPPVSSADPAIGTSAPSAQGSATVPQQASPAVNQFHDTGTSSSDPETLEIPSIGIKAKVQRVGLSRSGDLGTPNNFTDVGWYKYGTVPGDEGSSIIDGHVDNGLGLAAVFKNLSSVKLGDDIYVTSADGTKLHFRVIGIETYGYRDVPRDAIFGAGPGKRILRLITCDGTWVSSAKTYDERLIVTTELVTA